MGELATSGHTFTGAPVGGRRHGKSHKLRLVKKKTVRRMLAKKGLKMRGGGEDMTSPPAMGGRRRSHKRTHRRKRGMFHF